MVVPRDRRHLQGGFSVAEVLCGVAVLSVLSLSLVHSTFGQSRAIQRAYQDTVAVTLAQAELEQVRAAGAPLVVGEHTFELPGSPVSLPAGSGLRSVRELSAGIYEVEARVQWLPVGAKQPAVVCLTTRIAMSSQEAR